MLILFWLFQTWPVTLRIQEKVFSGCTVLPNNEETQLGSSNQEASSSADKNTGIVLAPCCAWKCVPTVISGGVNISEFPGCHLLWQMSSQWGSQELLHGLVSQELTAYLSVFNQFLHQWIMFVISKGCKPDNFKLHNSLKLYCMLVSWSRLRFRVNLHSIVCLNVNELLARSWCHIWSLSDCIRTQTHKDLVRKQTINHLDKWLSVRLQTKWLWVWVLLQSLKSLKLNFTNIWVLCSTFVECESFLHSNTLDIPAPLTFLTWMTQLILAISLWGLISL